MLALMIRHGMSTSCVYPLGTRRAFELAAGDGLREAALIAVEGAADYWRGLGFVEGPVSGELRAKVATYGSLACWMTREIP